MLTADHINRYHENGFVIPDWRLPAADLAAMRAAADAMLAARPHYADLHPALMEEGAPWPAFGHHPDLVAMVSQLIGPDLILWSMGYFGKPAVNGKATPWHQDGQYWPIRPLATCTAWLALDDATPENGCLRMIEGSHKERRLLAHDRNDSATYTLNQELPETAYDAARARDLVLEAGQVSLHDAFMVHGSAANTSAHRRRAITFRYMPANSHFDRDLAARQHAELGVVEHTYRTLYQVSGRDLSGRNELIRPRPPVT
ncbi:MAG: phytanoyl-CoA dioxygenase family protein [Thalassobaculaceae bacterium]